MVPEGWVRRNLAQVADVRTGVAKGKTGLKNPVSLPYLRVANVQDGYLNLNEMKEIEVEATQVERYSLRSGDIVLTEGGDFDKLGRGTIWRGQVSNCLHQNHVFAVRITSPHLMPEFFAMQAGSKYGRDYFLSCAKRSTNLASINSTQLKQFPVLLPPLPEQQKIAEILGTWDKAIETTEALLANARTQKRALMQSLLTGTRRFPGFKDHPWREVRLGEVFSERSERGREGLPLLSITSGRGVVGQDEIDRRDISRDDKSSYKRICVGDIGYNTMRMWQGVSALSGREGLVSPAYTIVRPGPKVMGRFAAHLFKYPEVIDKFRRHSQGLTSDTWNLKFPNFARISVTLPELEEQGRIVETLDLADAKINGLQAQADHLHTEKKSLMQQLLTGKRRVLV